MTDSATTTATYTINVPDNYRTLTLSTVGSGTTDPAPGFYAQADGSEVPVQATPNAGWAFDHWLLDGTVQVDMNPISITMGRDRDAKAVFVQTQPATPTSTPNSKPTATPTQTPSPEPTANTLFKAPLEILGLTGIGLLVAVICVAAYLTRKRNKNRAYEIDKEDGTVTFGDGEKGSVPPSAP